jgi:hypothetical protein
MYGMKSCTPWRPLTRKCLAHLNAASPSVQYPHDLASLAVHMEAQVKFQQVRKHVIADAAEGGLHSHTKTATPKLPQPSPYTQGRLGGAQCIAQGTCWDVAHATQ